MSFFIYYRPETFILKIFFKEDQDVFLIFKHIFNSKEKSFYPINEKEFKRKSIVNFGRRNKDTHSLGYTLFS